jgi:hypothetical protein
MKALATQLFIILTAVIATAQTAENSQTPPGVTVLKFSCYKDHHRPTGNVDPFRPAVESFNDVRARAEKEARLRELRNSPNASPAEVQRLEESLRPVSAPLIRERTVRGYTYEVSVKNDSSKIVKAVDWDYAFIDPATQKEVARHHFHSEEEVRPGRHKALRAFTTFPPTKVVSAGALGQKGWSGFQMKVTLRRVSYSDGSVWQEY